jgi:pyrophosphate--fructose-6-phosphate 1-phosphotransferase
MFDCSLGSTMGYTAAVLVQHGLTGLAVSVTNVTQPAKMWRCGAVPILGMLDSLPKQGFLTSALKVKSDNVEIGGRTFQDMKSLSKAWRIQDQYTNPGPIQFYLDEADENNKIPVTLDKMFSKSDDMTEQIRGLCQSI